MRLLFSSALYRLLLIYFLSLSGFTLRWHFVNIRDAMFVVWVKILSRRKARKSTVLLEFCGLLGLAFQNLTISAIPMPLMFIFLRKYYVESFLIKKRLWRQSLFLSNRISKLDSLVWQFYKYSIESNSFSLDRFEIQMKSPGKLY